MIRRIRAVVHERRILIYALSRYLSPKLYPRLVLLYMNPHFRIPRVAEPWKVREERFGISHLWMLAAENGGKGLAVKPHVLRTVEEQCMDLSFANVREEFRCNKILECLTGFKQQTKNDMTAGSFKEFEKEEAASSAEGKMTTDVGRPDGTGVRLSASQQKAACQALQSGKDFEGPVKGVDRLNPDRVADTNKPFQRIAEMVEAGVPVFESEAKLEKDIQELIEEEERKRETARYGESFRRLWGVERQEDVAFAGPAMVARDRREGVARGKCGQDGCGLRAGSRGRWDQHDGVEAEPIWEPDGPGDWCGWREQSRRAPEHDGDREHQ